MIPVLALSTMACRSDDGVVTLPGGTVPDTPLDSLEVADEGLSSGYQDTYFGNWQRGRGAAVLDYDLDGKWDVASFNTGDLSFLMHNVTPPGGPIEFEARQVFSVPDDLLW